MPWLPASVYSLQFSIAVTRFFHYDHNFNDSGSNWMQDHLWLVCAILQQIWQEPMSLGSREQSSLSF